MEISKKLATMGTPDTGQSQYNKNYTTIDEK
jgi:hypothetical protein